jgi:hypothetical protein
MATELQFRRYTTSDLQNIIGKAGELILDSDTWELTSHDGQTPGGNKIISTVSLNLENVDNTADLDKPISTATQAALDDKADDTDVVKLTGNQTVEGEKTFADVLTGPNVKTGVGTAGSGTLIGDIANNTADGDFSHAEGNNTEASGDYSHAEGRSTQASGESSHAEGDSSEASALAAHAEGDGTKASGIASHAEGRSTEAQGEASHAGGISSFASGVVSSATGRRARAIHAGAKVVADNQNFDISSTTTNQHTTRFENGYRWLGGAHEAENDIEITDFEKGVILPSQNGTRWRITVNDDGNLITTQIAI